MFKEKRSEREDRVQRSRVSWGKMSHKKGDRCHMKRVTGCSEVSQSRQPEASRSWKKTRNLPALLREHDPNKTL